jgi:hypothetical protein
MSTRFSVLAYLVVAACTHPIPNSQPPEKPVLQATKPWADSSATGPRAEIYRTWLLYLGSKAGHYGAGAWQPSQYWLASEQQRWHVYDLAMAYMPDSATPDVISIDSVAKDEYRVVTRFTEDSAASPMRASIVRMTVFAVRDEGHWVFANALPRLTRSWRREAVRGLTYVMEPGYPFDRTRAERAAAFVDSLATAFGVPRLTSFTYYLTTSSDEIYRIMGLETDIKWGPVGGVAQPTNHQLFSGNPAVGEDYRHELAHMVLLPLMGNTLYFVSEGVPTWVGGTSGLDFTAAARQFAGFLSEHPCVTLDSILDGAFPPQQFYPAAAVFAAMANDEGGVAAVKALYDSGDDFRKSMERLFKKPWPQIAADWRTKALSFARY